jgi:exonuclease SbcD
MKILHTSDWHIGRTLYGRKRYEEFESFLNWMINTINQNNIDCLLVAGDVFDTSAPSNRAQELYYKFLYDVSLTCCKNIVIIAGNHDSPSFLNAPRYLLRVLNVHVIGDVTENPEDEIITIKNRDGSVSLVVCAVPYLRDREIRSVEAGESVEDKGRKLVEGIKLHYDKVYCLAEKIRKEAGDHIPLIALGHLFTSGGQTMNGDGVRELYVGSLAHVGSEVFNDGFDYVALGHLHLPQKVCGSEKIRYCGSPFPMGFGEAQQDKIVHIIEFSGRNPQVLSIDVPEFKRLEQIRGTLDTITAKILELSALQSDAWLEITYQGEEIISNLREQLETAVAGTAMEILLTRNNRIVDKVMSRINDEETLYDLKVEEVFERCLEVNKIPDEQRLELRSAYQETIASLDNDDVKAE